MNLPNPVTLTLPSVVGSAIGTGRFNETLSASRMDERTDSPQAIRCELTSKPIKAKIVTNITWARILQRENSTGCRNFVDVRTQQSKVRNSFMHKFIWRQNMCN